ncbi:hypothetical protein MOQ72_19870 [Saccharopolyspora sp. K220]|uniref:hypothetical protein n=1 Tax=Saccharopolyspora soli TaxID=2926618 RepID=UPI001F59E79E|nr:hypothetical protein [Saccharopolyspora soli]MCI2419707.1 hypothetical protein [Saccharopolyspora soli]
MSTTIDYSPQRHLALGLVQEERVRFHNGLHGMALGYTWLTGESMDEPLRTTLHELWRVDAIQIETHRLFASGGHCVKLTPHGFQMFQSWATVAA